MTYNNQSENRIKRALRSLKSYLKRRLATKLTTTTLDFATDSTAPEQILTSLSPLLPVETKFWRENSKIGNTKNEKSCHKRRGTTKRNIKKKTTKTLESFFTVLQVLKH